MTVTDIDWEIIKFQSTLPRGERRYIIMTTLAYTKFQSTLPRGERPASVRTVNAITGFQSTLPRGERPILKYVSTA